jgi:hypothetical protein
MSHDASLYVEMPNGELGDEDVLIVRKRELIHKLQPVLDDVPLLESYIDDVSWHFTCFGSITLSCVSTSVRSSYSCLGLLHPRKTT